MKLAGNLTVVKEFKTLFLTCICYFLLVLSSCLSHPCLHGGTCIDTYFLHNDMNAVELYSSPSFADSQQNAMAYICKCIAPFAGRNCEGNVLFSRKLRDHLVGVKSNLFCLKLVNIFGLLPWKKLNGKRLFCILNQRFIYLKVSKTLSTVWSVPYACTQTWTTDCPSLGLIIFKGRLLSVIITDCSPPVALIKSNK